MNHALHFSWMAALPAIACMAADGPSPYPGGSPFPPGTEPALTHVVKAYWSTLDGVTTHIDVTANGARPIQYEVMGMQAGMAPECDVHLRISATTLERANGIADYLADGQGTVVISVYGFKREDHTMPPRVSVRYLKEGKLIGETTIAAAPPPTTSRAAPAP